MFLLPGKRCNFLMPDYHLLKGEGKNWPEQQLGKGNEAFGGNDMVSTFPDMTFPYSLSHPHPRLCCLVRLSPRLFAGAHPTAGT